MYYIEGIDAKQKKIMKKVNIIVYISNQLV